MDYLSRLENESVYIIREAYARHRDCALLWSIGKDSTTMLWLARKAFLGNIPFPVVNIDTGRKFRQIYEFRDTYAREWGLDLIIARNETAFKKGVSPDGGKFECCNELKTITLRDTIARNRFKALLLGIRRDEHGVRAKERYFSPRTESFNWNYRDQPAELWNYHAGAGGAGKHLRVHPLLKWTETDVWEYIKREKIPMVGLYFSVNGKRYRSIGCETCCAPIDSRARTIDGVIEELKTTRIPERSGRAQDKEDSYTMLRLRSLGYM